MQQQAILSRTKRQEVAEPQEQEAGIMAETDDLLDEIDQLLEETVVSHAFIQKGGE